MKVTLETALEQVPVGATLSYGPGGLSEGVKLEPAHDVDDQERGCIVCRLVAAPGTAFVGKVDRWGDATEITALPASEAVKWTAEAGDIANYLAKVAREETTDVPGERDVF